MRALRGRIFNHSVGIDRYVYTVGSQNGIKDNGIKIKRKKRKGEEV